MWIEALLVALLVGPYLVCKAYDSLAGHTAPRSTAALSGVTLLFCFTGIGHFLVSEPMARMFPAWMPAQLPLIYITGVMEIVAGVAILVPRLRLFVAWGLIVMLIGFLPVNIDAAMRRVPFGGHEFGPIYLLLRIPMQILFAGWIWWFALRRGSRLAPNLPAAPGSEA